MGYFYQSSIRFPRRRNEINKDTFITFSKLNSTKGVSVLKCCHTIFKDKEEIKSLKGKWDTNGILIVIDWIKNLYKK